MIYNLQFMIEEFLISKERVNVKKSILIKDESCSNSKNDAIE